MHVGCRWSRQLQQNAGDEDTGCLLCLGLRESPHAVLQVLQHLYSSVWHKSCSQQRCPDSGINVVMSPYD
jgi:hypothetical protein